MNLAEETDVLAFCEQKRAEMAESFIRHGRYEVNGFSFSGYVFSTRRPPLPEENRGEPDPSRWKPGPKLDAVTAGVIEAPAFCSVILPPEHHSRLFRHLCDEMVRATEAVGVLMMTEMWQLEREPKPGETLDNVRGPEGSWENVPGRKEVLYVSLDHRATGYRVWTAEIRRDPTRLEPWVEKPFAKSKGKLVGVMPQERDPRKVS